MSIRHILKHTSQSGFTLVEAGIVVPILIVALLGLSSTLYLAFQMNANERIEASGTYALKSGLALIEKDVLLTSQFLSVQDSSVNDPYRPSTGWSYVGAGLQQRTLLLRSYASQGNPDSNSRQPIFINQVGCDVDHLYYNDVYTYNTVYFVQDTNLYRRRLINTSVATCGTLYQQQSCPSLEILGVSSRDASCQADDELILTNVTGFRIDYYTASNSPSPLDAYDSALGPNLIVGAGAVNITITTSHKVLGRDNQISASLFMSRSNTTMR